MKTLGDKADAWVRAYLESLEEEILSAYLARAQFAHNEAVYEKGYFGNPDESMLDKMLLELETVYSKFGRYIDPVERPFNDNLPEPERQVIVQDHSLMIADYNQASVTPLIMQVYLRFLDRICEPGDDRQHGSSAEHDIAALQVTSQRIHAGMLVAEWKYDKNPETYWALIQRKDEKGLLETLTDKGKEDEVAARIYAKAEERMNTANQDVRQVISPFEFMHYFMRNIVPLTKQVEVLYFLNRTMEPTG